MHILLPQQYDYPNWSQLVQIIDALIYVPTSPKVGIACNSLRINLVTFSQIAPLRYYCWCSRVGKCLLISPIVHMLVADSFLHKISRAGTRLCNYSALSCTIPYLIITTVTQRCSFLVYNYMNARYHDTSSFKKYIEIRTACS
jgi:hypothetical protein